MAYVPSGSTYHSNAVPGWLNGINDSDLYDVSSTAKFAVGSGFKRADGNIYRYGNFITAVAQGKLVSHVVADVDNKYATSVVTVGTSATQQGADPVGVYPSLIGSRYIMYVLASCVKDQFAGGYVVIGRGTGVGYTYRIKGNTASATINGVANSVIIELYGTLIASLDASTYVSVIGSLYNDLIVGGASTNYVCVGVTQANMTANTYGWICTHGVTGALADGTLTNGCAVQQSIVTAGAVSQYGVGTTSNASNTLFVQQPIGWCIDPAASTYYATISLTIE